MTHSGIPDGAAPGGGLPIAGGPPPRAERSDAARNRQAVLAVAAEFIREHGVEALTLDAIAQRAGVGKGTIFRRFGNRAGLMRSLVDHTETEFQAGFMFGPPPLGPGAEPLDRLIAYGRERLNFLTLEGDVQRDADRSVPVKYSVPAHQLHTRHLRFLLHDAGAKGDLQLLAQSLQATLDAGLILYQSRELGIPLDRIADHWESLVRLVVPPTRPEPVLP